MYYGNSGTGKSEAIAAIIKAIYKETGKTARVIIGDGSAATYDALVDAGIVEMLDYTTRDWPLTTLTQLLKGYWPEDPNDPNSKLLPITPEQFARIGVYGIEGLTVMSNYIMGDKKGGFAEQMARGIKIGGENPVKIIDAELDAAGNPIANSGPGTKFGGTTLAGYGIAQKRILGLLEHAKGLPGWVIFTAHERVAEDRVTNQKVVGPEAAGGALTANLSKHFNNTLHFTTVEKKVKVKDAHTEANVDVLDAEYRIYTRDHFRPEGGMFVKYRAVSRTPYPQGWPDETGKKKVGAMPLYFESDTPGEAIQQFYSNIKQARLHSIADLPQKVA